MTHSWGKRQKDSLAEVGQFKQSEITLNCWIELILESLSIFNPGIFYTFFSFVKAVQEDVETRAALNLLFFLNLTNNFLREFEPCVFWIFCTNPGSTLKLPMRVAYIQPK